VILVDTGPLVALCDSRDSHHTRALDDLRSLRRADLVACEPILVEACFHLPHLAQRRRLQAVIDEFDIRAIVIDDMHAFRSAVFQWLTKYAEHEPDWADACIAVLSAHHNQLKVWTYDREFKTTWRRPDGSSIPLAIKL
jgi:predicted nucleic acid-binding protein